MGYAEQQRKKQEFQRKKHKSPKLTKDKNRKAGLATGQLKKKKAR